MVFSFSIKPPAQQQRLVPVNRATSGVAQTRKPTRNDSTRLSLNRIPPLDFCSIHFQKAQHGSKGHFSVGNHGHGVNGNGTAKVPAALVVSSSSSAPNKKAAVLKIEVRAARRERPRQQWRGIALAV